MKAAPLLRFFRAHHSKTPCPPSSLAKALRDGRSFSEGGQHSATPILRRVITPHMLGSLSFRKFVRMSLFEADALENGRADIASDKETPGIG